MLLTTSVLELKWLLIFDNVESWDTIAQYVPSVNGCIIITSQLLSLTQVVRTSIALDPFLPDAGASFLLNYMRKDVTNGPTYDAALEICKMVGGVPIALAHVAGTLIDSQISLQECARRFRKQDTSGFLNAATRPDALHAYNKRLSLVWDVAYSELSPLARRVLDVLSFLNADSIPENLLIVERDEEATTYLQKKLV